MRLLGKVEAIFTVSNRGVVIAPVGISDLRLNSDDSIQLRASDGHVKETRILAVESLNMGSGNPRKPALMLPADVDKSEITEGMEIWRSKD